MASEGMQSEINNILETVR